MTAVRVDTSGRMVIPAAVRADLDVKNGGEVELEHGPDGWTLKPISPPRLVRRDGHLVVDIGRVVTTKEILEWIQEDRDARG